jgi:hypothetical protein
MAAVFFFIVILAVAMAMMGSMNPAELPPGLRFLTEKKPVAQIAVPVTAPGFGLPTAPGWHEGWKLYVLGDSFVAGHKLQGAFKDYDAPDLNFGCKAGGSVQAFVDSRLPLVEGKSILLDGKKLSARAHTDTWHQLRLGDKLLQAEAVLRLPYVDGVGEFTVPEHAEAVQAVLGETCKQQGLKPAAAKTAPSA